MELSKEQVTEIDRRLRAKETDAAIAETMGLSRDQLRRAVKDAEKDFARCLVPRTRKRGGKQSHHATKDDGM